MLLLHLLHIGAWTVPRLTPCHSKSSTALTSFSIDASTLFLSARLRVGVLSRLILAASFTRRSPNSSTCLHWPETCIQIAREEQQSTDVCQSAARLMKRRQTCTTLPEERHSQVAQQRSPITSSTCSSYQGETTAGQTHRCLGAVVARSGSCASCWLAAWTVAVTRRITAPCRQAASRPLPRRSTVTARVTGPASCQPKCGAVTKMCHATRQHNTGEHVPGSNSYRSCNLQWS